MQALCTTDVTGMHMLPRGPENAAEGRRAGAFSAVLIQGDCLPLRGLGNKRLCRRSMGKGGERLRGGVGRGQLEGITHVREQGSGSLTSSPGNPAILSCACKGLMEVRGLQQPREGEKTAFLSLLITEGARAQKRDVGDESGLFSPVLVPPPLRGPE